MEWIKYRICTTVEAEDMVCAMLMDLGIEGFEIEDNQPLTKEELAAMYVDIGPEIPNDEGVAYISFYIEETEVTTANVQGGANSSSVLGDALDNSTDSCHELQNNQLLSQVKEGLNELSNYVDIGVASIEKSTTADVDWINNWKQYFKQFTIDDVLVIPSWEDVEPEHTDKMIVQIDPGTAFGTGMHDTTQLCVRQIKKHINEGDTILDVGCGSGILGMLALKFGGNYSLGTDLDPCAITATHENMSVNHITEECYDVIAGNIIDTKDIQDQVGYNKYNIVAANILTEVLVPLTPVIKETLVDGGLFITSGIINVQGKEETLTKVLVEYGFEIVEVTYQGEWVSITARK